MCFMEIKHLFITSVLLGTERQEDRAGRNLTQEFQEIWRKYGGGSFSEQKNHRHKWFLFKCQHLFHRGSEKSPSRHYFPRSGVQLLSLIKPNNLKKKKNVLKDFSYSETSSLYKSNNYYFLGKNMHHTQTNLIVSTDQGIHSFWSFNERMESMKMRRQMVRYIVVHAWVNY